MINEVQLSDNTTFQAKFYPHPNIEKRLDSDVLKKFEQITANRPNLGLRQCSSHFHSEQSDAFALYKDNKYLCTLSSKFNDVFDKSGQSDTKGDVITYRLVEIFDNLMKKANL